MVGPARWLRNRVVLTAFAGGLLLLVLAWWYQAVRGDGPQPAGRVPGVIQRPAGPPAAAQAGRIGLDRLTAERPQPGQLHRNLFRFESPKAAPGSTPPPPARPAPGPLTANVQPPPPPAIPLRFIGIVEDSKMKLAVLTDGRDVFYGKEGDVLDGRYRIVRIGVESVELEHVDGRGRQTIRLSG